MAIVVEDGSGIESAISYVDLAFADSYFTVRGIATWTGEDAAKEVALVRATEYADARWGRKLRGYRKTAIQALEFPRSALYTQEGYRIEGVPELWKRAICEYALISLTGTLERSVEADTEQTIESKSITVGPIKTAYSYGAPNKSVPLTFPKADRLAKMFTASSSRVIRA